MEQVSRSGVWFSAGAALLGLGATLLLAPVVDWLHAVGWVLLFVGNMCLGVSAAAYFGVAETGRSLHLAAETQRSTNVESHAEPRFSIDEQGRIFVNVTHSELMEMHKQHTSIHGRHITEPYIGKWLKVSGELHDVSAYDNTATMYVTLRSKPPLTLPDITLHLKFDKSTWGDRLSLLHRGDRVAIVGKIKEIDAVGVTLAECEVV